MFLIQAAHRLIVNHFGKTILHKNPTNMFTNNK